MENRSVASAPRLAGLAGIIVLALVGIGAYDYLWPKLTLFHPAYMANHFRAMDEVFPARTIRRSDHPFDIPVSETMFDEDVSYMFDGEAQHLEAFLTRSQTTSFLIIHKGKIVSERFFKGYDQDDVATSFSVAKSFIATMVGIALEDGLIESLDDPITRYVPALKESGFDGVPISSILQMSSGIGFSEVYGDETSDAYTIYDKMFIYLRPITSITTDFPRIETPGSSFHYASINTQALGMLLTAVTGGSITDYMAEKIWGPLGAAGDASWLVDLHGNEISFFGLNAAPRDFAKLGLLYLNDGKWNGRQIVSSDWVRRATTPDKPFLAPGEIDEDWGYQYQWWVPRRSEDIFGKDDYAAVGIYGQMIYVNPQADLVIVKTSADPEFKPHEYEAVTLFRAIAARLER